MSNGNNRHTTISNSSTRSIALLVLISIFIGNLLPELGDLLAIKFGLYSHYFNKPLFVIGIVGIIGFSIALYCGRNNNHSTDVDLDEK